VHGLENMDHPIGAIRKFLAQPLAEQLFDFERQSQQDIASVAGPRIACGGEDWLNLVVGETGRDRGRRRRSTP
jgi:hypothetical protein